MEDQDLRSVVRDLHAARVRGDLEALCRLFSDSGAFRISGSSDGKPIAIAAEGIAQFRPWLGMLVKAFGLSDYQLLRLLVEDAHASVHWSARIYSKITGIGVSTELVDLVHVEEGRIVEYTEFFVPR